MEPTQVLKGMLDTAVLGALSREPTYGYELVTRLRAEGFAEIGDASVYGTLRRLHRSGFLASEIVESEVGPARKYYSVNREGEAELRSSIKTWNEIKTSMDGILERGRTDEQF
ncbi:MAG: PadR family transcriptional regulator [Acidimicrobiia bacterium]